MLLSLASALCSIGIDRSAIGCLGRQIHDLMQTEFSSCIVSLCNRSCNKVADCLATYGAGMLASDSALCWSQAPEFVRELVLGDLPRGDV
uniref:RNase H type-1 domain-containing protein n=1 Tax=Setaria italica TaxID=4555 RepID=K3ZN52_SETIT